MNFNMPQQKKDVTAILQVRGKLILWSYKKISLIKRILVANQMIWASIWYLASCTNIYLSSLGKVKTFVCNYVWFGKANHKVWVRVAQDTTILPLIRRDNKILYLKSQTSILGTFMVEVHKKTILPQNHCQNITLNDHYNYKIIYFEDYYFSLDIHICLD